MKQKPILKDADILVVMGPVEIRILNQNKDDDK